MILTAVPVEQVPKIWTIAGPMLGKAAETTGPRFSEMDIFDHIMDGALALWVVIIDDTIVAALTTRIVAYNKCKALSIDWVGGSRMREWFDQTLDTMEKYARESGCSRLEGYGRKAWGRTLAKRGWEPDYIAYKMELNDVKG